MTLFFEGQWETSEGATCHTVSVSARGDLALTRRAFSFAVSGETPTRNLIPYLPFELQHPP